MRSDTEEPLGGGSYGNSKADVDDVVAGLSHVLERHVLRYPAQFAWSTDILLAP